MVEMGFEEELEGWWWKGGLRRRNLRGGTWGRGRARGGTKGGGDDR